jgi:hypothetical protein
MLQVSSVPPVYQTMLSVPNLALENAMACRVYRAVKLGLIRDYHSSHYAITVPSLSTTNPTNHELAFKRPTLNESRNMEVNVNITTSTDTELRDDHLLGKEAPLVKGGSDIIDRV